MTKIDFYILGDQSPANGDQITCRLVEKIANLGHKIFIHVEDKTQQQHVDDLLWSYKADSFIAHEVVSETSNCQVLIGQNDLPPAPHDVLVNLSKDVPTFFSQFSRVAEIIEKKETSKKTGRERYLFYRDRGYELSTHPIQ